MLGTTIIICLWVRNDVLILPMLKFYHSHFALTTTPSERIVISRHYKSP